MVRAARTALISRIHGLRGSADAGPLLSSSSTPSRCRRSRSLQPIGAGGVFRHGLPDDVALGLAQARRGSPNLFHGLVVERERGLDHTVAVLPYQTHDVRAARPRGHPARAGLRFEVA